MWVSQTANSRTITLDIHVYITLSLRTAEAATTQHVSVITMHHAVILYGELTLTREALGSD